MGGMPSSATRLPFTRPKPRPITSPAMTKTTDGSSGCARPSMAVSMPVRARLAATDRSMPRVRITIIWAMAIMNKKAVSFSVDTRLSGVPKAGA